MEDYDEENDLENEEENEEGKESTENKRKSEKDFGELIRDYKNAGYSTKDSIKMAYKIMYPDPPPKVKNKSMVNDELFFGLFSAFLEFVENTRDNAISLQEKWDKIFTDRLEKSVVEKRSNLKKKEV